MAMRSQTQRQPIGLHKISHPPLTVSAKLLVAFGILSALSGAGTIIPGILMITTSYGQASNYNANYNVFNIPGYLLISAGIATFLAGFFCCIVAFSSSPRKCGNGMAIIWITLVEGLVAAALVVPLTFSQLTNYISAISSTCTDCENGYNACSFQYPSPYCWYSQSTYNQLSLLNTVALVLTAIDLVLLAVCFASLSIACCVGPSRQQKQYLTLKKQRYSSVEMGAPRAYYNSPMKPSVGYEENDSLVFEPVPPPPPPVLSLSSLSRSPTRHHHHHHHSNSSRIHDSLALPPPPYTSNINLGNTFSLRSPNNNVKISNVFEAPQLHPPNSLMDPVLSQDKWSTLFPQPR